MEVLLSKEHYCFQIHIIYILMKSSAYLPSIIEHRPSFLQENLDPAPFYEFSKISAPYK